MSAEEKLCILEEVKYSGVTISEVWQHHQVSHAQFYRWERIARQGALKALRNGSRKVRNGKREEWLVTEVNRPRIVVVELTAENLTLKGGSLFEATPALF